MCGICGYVLQNGPDEKTLLSLNDLMQRRGPNDSGARVEHVAEFDVGLAQRRLSILDLSSKGHQPMQSYNGRFSLVFNGEIYNFETLKKSIDYPYQSSGDTDSIFAAYEKWGIESLAHLSGMFAIGLLDRQKQELILMRDRVGKKPLYYYQKDGGFFFASELKPIMAFEGFEKCIRKDVLQRYLFHGYVAAPDTIFENTFKLEPGCFLRFDLKSGQIETKRYWDPVAIYKEKQKAPVENYEEAKQSLQKTIEEATRVRMVADVPLGTLLSGGYDSSLVTAVAQSLNDKPMQTFCIGFDEKEFNEALYAKEIAQHLGCEHHELYLGEKDIFDMVENIPEAYDEPFADSSQIPTMLVSRLAKEKVTVALSGDGGDEFFCGYMIYDAVAKGQRLDWIGAMVYGVTQCPPFKQMHLLDKLPFLVQAVAENRDKRYQTQFGGRNYEKGARDMLGGFGIDEKYDESYIDIKKWQRRRQMLDIRYYLSDDILCKVDRASMFYSLETRSPLLDKEVMELSFVLPQNFLFEKGNGKRILKDIAHDYIPKEMLNRPKKGFAVPIEKWLCGALKDQLLAYSRKKVLAKQGVFEPQATQDLIDQFLKTGDGGSGSGQNFSRLAWAFLVFQWWYERYIEVLS